MKTVVVRPTISKIATSSICAILNIHTDVLVSHSDIYVIAVLNSSPYKSRIRSNQKI